MTGPATALAMMRRAGAWLVMAAGAGVMLGAAEPGVELLWRNGEVLPGRVVAAGRETVSFQPELPDAAGLFEEPAELRLERVEALRVAGEAGAKREENFQVRLKDGSHLLADVVRLDGGWLRLTSALAGAFAVKRDEVIEVTRVRGPDVVFFASGPEVKWAESLKLERVEDSGPEDPFAVGVEAPPGPRVLRVYRNRSGAANEEALRLWHRMPSGGLGTVSWSNTLRTTLQGEAAKRFPKSVRLDLRLSAKQRPRFVFKLDTPEGELRVETWEDLLVLREGTRFREVKDKLKDEPTELRLTVLWNRDTHEVRLLSELGEELAGLGASGNDVEAGAEVPKLPGSRQPEEVAKPEGPVIALENLGLDLALDSLSVTAWNGERPDALPAGEVHARLLSGRVIRGEWLTCDGKTLTLKPSGAEAGEKVDLAQVFSVQTAAQLHAQEPDLAKLSRAGAMMAEARTGAGEWVHGVFEGIEEAKDQGSRPVVKLGSAVFEESLRLVLPLLDGLSWVNPEGAGRVEAGALVDCLKAGPHLVRGRMVAAGDALPRWQFDGAVAAVRLSPGVPAVIERDPRQLPAVEGSHAGALLHLKSGDLVAARLNVLQRDAVMFTAPGVMPTSLAPAEVNAILFPGAPLQTQDFADPGWQQLSGEEAVFEGGDRKEIRLKPGHAVGHPAMMEGEGLELTLHDSLNMGVGSLRLTLFARNLEGREESLRLLVAFVGDEIYCGDESEEGQLRRQGQVPKTTAEARVQIRLHEQNLRVRINGAEVVSFPVTESMRPGSGLILEPGSLWGNPAQPVRVTGFSVQSKAQRLRVPQVEEEVRAQTLTIPRSRTEEPPSHVLIAPTGDVLRGTVEGIEDGVVDLRWGMETLQVPQERVAAMVLLEPLKVEAAGVAAGAGAGAAVKSKGTSAPGVPHWVLMRDGGRLGLTLQRWADEGVVGMHPRLGRVVIPTAAVQALWIAQSPPVTDAMRAVSGWVLRQAVAPEIPEDAAGTSSLTGTEAKDFTLPLLDGPDFVLQKERGKVVVLDFWATWCAPCLKALPELMEAMKELPSDQVRLIGVNQAEPAEQLRTFLKTRNWALTTVLDADQAVGRRFGVEGIPHTVVIGPDGKIAMVKTGYTPTAAKEIVAKVRELLKGK